jgi:thioredoxin 1
MSVIKVNDIYHFNALILNKDGKIHDKLYVFVDFYAEWCGPCKKIAPVLDKWSKEYLNILFLKVDVDEVEQLVEKYKIKAMPTFIILKSGSEKLEHPLLVGAKEANLKKTIDKYEKMGEDIKSLELLDKIFKQVVN